MSKDKTMIRTRKNKDNPYVMLDKTGLHDSRLSWKAKGLHAYLMSLPDDWIIYISELTQHAKDGRDATRAAFKELELAGYITNEAIRNEKGRIEKWEKIVYEQPLHWDPVEIPKKKKKDNHPETENPYLDKNDEKPDTENPHLEKPHLENPTLLINDLTNKKIKQNNDSNNNNETTKNKIPARKDKIITPPFSVVVDLLHKHGIKINKATLTKWSQLADERIILAAVTEALDRPGVKNFIGYITKILGDGYVPVVNGSSSVSSKAKDLPYYIKQQLESGKQEVAAGIDPTEQKKAFDLLLQLGEIGQEEYERKIREIEDSL